ncbi:MAG: hypothetical protein K2Y40_12655 [Reyranella sp.]|nr:hypothetical protein [Reyranella sp.]
MPEEQTPFVHQDGSTSPPGRTTADKLLAPYGLKNQVAELHRERAMRARLYPGWVAAGRLKADVADAQLDTLGRAIETLQLLQEPRINALVLGMKALTPDYQTLVADILLALSVPGIGRQQLAVDLRKRIEGRSPGAGS